MPTTNSRIRSVKLGLAAGLMSMALAAPALAAPNLFQGNISIVNTYARDTICGKQLANGTMGAACTTPVRNNVSQPSQVGIKSSDLIRTRRQQDEGA